MTPKATPWGRYQMLRGILLPAILLLSSETASAGGDRLYGVHWWDFDGVLVGEGPYGGWTTETVLTHSAPWWSADYFLPLYQSVVDNYDASIITRIDYDWGQTIPAPGNPDRGSWASAVVDVVARLGDYSQVWILGNEPNIVGEGGDWPAGQITPGGYAEVYREIRAAIHEVRPNDRVLVAPPSPGHVIPGVRWMSGSDWLGQTIDAIHALAVDPTDNGPIDGFALHAYGNPFVGAEAAVAEFQTSLASQLAVIDNHGEQDRPVYLTEWARATSTSGNLPANEAETAAFIRGSLEAVDAWNKTPDRHNIVSMSWFVQNSDYGGWQEYSLEHWQQLGHPPGDQRDLWTALLSGADYPAGVDGTRMPTSGPAIGDFDGDRLVAGRDFLTWQRGYAIRRGVVPERGDANADGKIDHEDLAAWGRHFGVLVSQDAMHVPAPSQQWALLAVGASGTMVRRRRTLLPTLQF